MFFSFAFELSLASHHHPCLMNALFVLRPAKLRAFNFGHPCPSLVKGEVLSPEKIRASTGGIASRCTKPLRPYNHCKRTTTSRPVLNLPPLSKGGGLAARHKLLLCCVLLAICPPFLCYKLFCRQDGGIASRCTEPIYPHDHCKRTITPRSHQPFSKPHYPLKIANTLAFK